jgi:hypothetical protein
MKRVAYALVALGLTTFTVAPAFAASPQGAVQMKWNVAATASLTLATNYTTAAGAQSLGANTLQGSPTAGVCTSASSETALTMTFGALNASPTVETACNYQRAVLANVITNDSSGYKINEWLDQAPTTGIQFCAFPNGSTAAGAGPASVNTSAPAAISGSTCAGSGALLPAGSAATGTGPGQPGTAGIRSSTAPGTPYNWVSATTSTAGLNYGQDIQINLSANQASSTTDTSYIIIQLVPN